MIKLWLDDIRPAPEGYIRVYTTPDMIALLKSEEVEEISLDNDLGLLEPVGRKVLDWIEEEVVGNNYIPPLIHIHSMNSIEVARMATIRSQIQMRLDSKDVGKNIIGGGG